MLVLARRLNERIVIPCIEASVQIVGIQGNLVRLGIDAPADVKVFREEILHNDQGKAQAASAPVNNPTAGDRLACVTQKLTQLRNQVRDNVQAGATLDQLDRELAELKRSLRLAKETAAPNHASY